MQEEVQFPLFRENQISDFRDCAFAPPPGPFWDQKGTIIMGGADSGSTFQKNMKCLGLDQLLRHGEILQRGKRRPRFSEVSVAPGILLRINFADDIIRPNTK